MTIGLTNNSNIKLDYEDNVLNGKGEIAAVVHQYDRKPFIESKIKNKFYIEDKKEIKRIYLSKDYNKILLRFGFSLFIIIIFVFLIWSFISVIRALFKKIKKKQIKKNIIYNTLDIMKIN